MFTPASRVVDLSHSPRGNDARHSLSLEGQERTSASDGSYSSMSITAGIVRTCDDGPHSYP
jgi:hypothetical protein